MYFSSQPASVVNTCAVHDVGTMVLRYLCWSWRLLRDFCLPWMCMTLACEAHAHLWASKQHAPLHKICNPVSLPADKNPVLQEFATEVTKIINKAVDALEPWCLLWSGPPCFHMPGRAGFEASSWFWSPSARVEKLTSRRSPWVPMTHPEDHLVE